MRGVHDSVILAYVTHAQNNHKNQEPKTLA